MQNVAFMRVGGLVVNDTLPPIVKKSQVGLNI